jgi:hypothetical protein
MVNHNIGHIFSRKEAPQMEKTKELELIDLYLSSYLTLQGQEPRLINKGGKIIIVFDATDEVYRLMAEFNANPEVPCLSLITKIKTLRGKMLTAKESMTGHGNGERHGRTY